MSVLIANIGQTGPLTCFKAYDVRGELGVNFDAGAVIIGRDAGETSPVSLSHAAMARRRTKQHSGFGLTSTSDPTWALAA